jgi:hypothetical protein
MLGLIQFLPLVFVLLVVFSIVRNVLRLTKKLGDTTSSSPRAPEVHDPALAERTRRVQEEIRRKIAERRGTVAPPASAARETTREPPVVYGEPPPEPVWTVSNAAVLERQQQLADQMRALELARVAEQRRAVNVAATLKTAAESETGMLAASRDGLLADLRDPASLRRAFVLREILGAPVGLR